MKINTVFIQLLFVVIFLSSCSVNQYIAPPFTDVNKIIRLEPGLTKNEVSEILRIPPYDIVHSYETGSMILVYNYRVKDLYRRYPTRAARQMSHSEEAQREGEKWYNNSYQELYLLFVSDTLKSVFGERSFYEGEHIEMVDRNLIVPSMLDSTNVNYSFMRDFYSYRNARRQTAKLEVDEATERRQKLLRNAVLGAGLFGGLGISSFFRN